MELKDIESAVEAILFASGEPIPLERLALALELDQDTLEAGDRPPWDFYSYERRGIRLLGSITACSWPLRRNTQIGFDGPWKPRRPPQLSQAALESLAVIAYFQPTTKAYVEQIRGVDSSYTIGLLSDRGLIEECGRLAVPGRPILYRTTQSFLRSFGLKTLDELPELPDADPEDGQITMDMQAAIQKLKEEQKPQPEGTAT